MVSLTFSTCSEPPARLTPSVTTAPGWYLAICAARATRSFTARPSTATIASPCLRPASAAAVDAVHLLRDLVDARQGRDREDVPLLGFDHQLDVVRAAEGARVPVVDLHEGMALREQVAEARFELQLEAPIGEEPRDDEHDDHDRVAVVDEPLPEPIERTLVLLARGSAAHDRTPVLTLATAASSCRRRWCA